MEFKYIDFPSAYGDMLFRFKVFGEKQDTRNGPALVFPSPVLLTIYQPTQRVISDPNRNANPFFHVMETVWMLAGRMNPQWLYRFNKRMAEFADRGPLDSPVIWGAYGYRWLTHWGDQVSKVIDILKKDPNSRQAVLTMWDPHLDLGTNHKDRPCNTHIYFRKEGPSLTMTVCNRSNDFVWGMMGANAVHLTYLHETIATSVGMSVGTYRVFTNNLHFYTELYPNTDQIWESADMTYSVYDRGVFDEAPPCRPEPILAPNETFRQLSQDCRCFLRGAFEMINNKWLLSTALPMYLVYTENASPETIKAEDWKEASKQWLQRNRKDAII